MTIVTAHLRSTRGSLYQPGKAIHIPKPDKTSFDEHEKNTWRERGHYLPEPDNRMYIPAMAFKRALEDGAAYDPQKLKGQSMFTKLFQRSVIVTDPIILPVKKDQVTGESYFLPSDGVASSKVNKKSNFVWRTFPTVAEWSGHMVFHILDDRITEEVFTKALEDAGLYIGIGTWRPQRGGLNGRFEVIKLDWQKQESNGTKQAKTKPALIVTRPDKTEQNATR